MKQIDESRMRKMLEIAISTSGSQKAFAKEAQISEQYLSDVLNGRRDIGEKILKWFGMERVIYYRRADGGSL
jgi:hypothetical protein